MIFLLSVTFCSYIFIVFDNLECQNDYTGVSSKEKYVQTKELKQIFECAHMLTTQLDSSRGVCNLNEINRLYLEVGERFNKTHDWCYDELGINEHVSKNDLNSYRKEYSPYCWNRYF